MTELARDVFAVFVGEHARRLEVRPRTARDRRIEPVFGNQVCEARKETGTACFPHGMIPVTLCPCGDDASVAQRGSYAVGVPPLISGHHMTVAGLSLDFIYANCATVRSNT
jgi:hypothetical protein